MRRSAMPKPEGLDPIIRLPALAAIWAVGVAGAGIGWYSGAYVLNGGLPGFAYVYEKRCSGEDWSGPLSLHVSNRQNVRQQLRKVHPGCQIKARRPA